MEWLRASRLQLPHTNNIKNRITMEVEGKIIQLYRRAQRCLESRQPWKTKEYVLETKESYPRKIAFDFFGDRADQDPLNVGDEIRLSFDIESREYQGRWFTSIRGWKSEPLAATAPAGAPDPVAPIGSMPPPPADAAGSDSDLPF